PTSFRTLTYLSYSHLPPPPSSSLFPYTTLFRSHNTLCSEDYYNAISSFDCPRLLIADEAHNLGRISFIGNTPDYYEFRLALSATDRKSTRLNSSHVKISYAVFCLKKKIHKPHTT